MFLFALCMAIIAAAGYGVLRYVESTFIESAGQNLTTSAVNVSHQLDLLFKERYGDIQMMARAKDFRDRDRTTMTAYMQWIVETYPAYTWIGVTDETGHMIAATDPEKVGQDRIDRDFENIVPIFLANRQKDLQALRRALADDNFETIQMLGHRMRGDGGGYGFNQISKIVAPWSWRPNGRITPRPNSTSNSWKISWPACVSNTAN
ncbi:MAG: hypothetical protein OEU87_08695 [Nitrospira sp.]|nr:hypothetical protein [Nitrospira sp.]